LNVLDGVTSTTAELNILDGVTATTAELNFVDGVTSNIQTQLNAKANLDSPALTGTPTAPTATAGTNTTQLATTAFVQTALGGAASYTLLGTLTTTSGSSQTLSGLTLTDYKFLFLSVNGVSTSVSTYMRWAANNSHRITAELTVNSLFWSGNIIVDLATSKFAANIAESSATASLSALQGYGGPCALTNASTSVTIALNAGNFDAGSIIIYGVK
jgi:hypothetical protein